MSDILWTKHAKERNRNRQITEKWVKKTVNSPDQTKDLGGGKKELRKKFGSQTVTVVITKSREGKYLILSSWINPPITGTDDYKNIEYLNKLKSSRGIKKFWITILHQIGF